MDFFLSKSEKVITDFFINDSSLFIDLISEYYPLDKSLIDKYQDSLDWQKLSINENIIWTNDLIESYLGKWNWGNTYDEDGYYEKMSEIQELLNQADEILSPESPLIIFIGTIEFGLTTSTSQVSIN